MKNKESVALSSDENSNRSNRVYAAIYQYGGSSNNLEESAIDLLTDLQHLCRIRGLEFAKLLSIAERHFSNE